MSKWINQFKQKSAGIVDTHGDKVDIVPLTPTMSTLSPANLGISVKKIVEESTRVKYASLFEKYDLTVVDIKECLGDDFNDIENNPEAIEAASRLISDNRFRLQGKIPSSYTAKAHCQGCGDVWLPPALASVNPTLACPWCFDKAQGVVIPQPPCK